MKKIKRLTQAEAVYVFMTTGRWPLLSLTKAFRSPAGIRRETLARQNAFNARRRGIRNSIVNP